MGPRARLGFVETLKVFYLSKESNPYYYVVPIVAKFLSYAGSRDLKYE